MSDAIAITGASGFVGRHLGKVVQHAGLEARPVPRGLPADELRSALRGVAVVVHLAGLAHVLGKAPSEEEFFRVNAHYAGEVAAAAAAANVKRFVYVSSVKVNGERTTVKPFTAGDPAAPEDAYGRSKLAGEVMVAEVGRRTGIEVAIARPPLVFGPGVRANFARLVRLVNKGVPLPFGSIDNRRTLVGVENLCDFLLACARHPAAAGKLFLIGDEPAVSTPELVRLIGAGLERSVLLMRVPPQVLLRLGGIVGRGSEVSRLVESLEIDSSDARRTLDWTPPRTLAEGIARAAQALRDSR